LSTDSPLKSERPRDSGNSRGAGAVGASPYLVARRGRKRCTLGSARGAPGARRQLGALSPPVLVAHEHAARGYAGNGHFPDAEQLELHEHRCPRRALRHAGEEHLRGAAEASRSACAHPQRGAREESADLPTLEPLACRIVRLGASVRTEATGRSEGAAPHLSAGRI
jgi:hypothetical protein